jgi:hypothetical protein
MVSYKYKFLGVGLLLAGLALLVLNYYHRMKAVMPVFAVQSSYIKTTYLTVIKTNVIEEIIMLCLLGGLLLIVFSYEKKEQIEFINLRNESWRIAIIINSAILVFSVLFIYGKGFLAILILNMYSTPIIYYIVFHIKKTGKLQNQTPNTLN